ncbi:MAG: SGNH/GDSL hydrolase family protein [Planctomycetota bacterium]
MAKAPKHGRRDFLTTGAALGAAGWMSNVAQAEHREAASSAAAETSLITSGDTILFQGDSITDAGRNRDIAKPNDAAAMGGGYAFLASASLLAQRPADSLKVHNRGISGHKVHQLAERWQVDCLDLKPDVLSILIGVNDIWHSLDWDYDGTVETYRIDYFALAERTKKELPNVKLVICEPFVLKTGAVDDRWFPAFDEFRAAAKAVAEKYADAWAPFQTVFDEAVKFAPPERWAGDGVHPSPDGAALMANAWLRAVGA